MVQQGLFLVTGLPATGKSTLARALARTLGMPLLAKDAIKEPLLEILGAADPAASRRLSDASFAALFSLADVQLTAVGAVVLEGNFRAGEHEPLLRALLARHAVPCTQVLCRVPEPLRQARLKARAADPGRHPGHQDAVWVAAVTQPDGFLDLEGPRHFHDGAVVETVPGSALIRSLANRQLV
ncbi:MAG TPA: ATP-binding protein [Steroidobacteraceae bacterium]|nr:ATP-binding protein [Steroidobacteraceae bacterium]